MLRQPKYQSILVFALCLLGAVLAFKFLRSPDLLKWHLSVVDNGPLDYRTEVPGPTLVVSDYLTNSFFPDHHVIIYSPKGICMRPQAKWDISSSDRSKEGMALVLLHWAPLGMDLSFLMLILSFANLLRCWCKKGPFLLYLIPTAVVFLYVASVVGRLLGPRISWDPDFLKSDFDCTYSIVIRAELISTNWSVLVLLALVVLLQLVAVVLLIRSSFAEAAEKFFEVAP